MREVPYPDDLERLRDAVRDELAVQQGISGQTSDNRRLDTLTDMVVARIDYGFDVRWKPKWIPIGDAHRWTGDGEHHVECLSCRRITAHASGADADAWYEAHCLAERGGAPQLPIGAALQGAVIEQYGRMPTDSVRSRLDAKWEQIDSAAVQSKDSQRAVRDLIRVFEAVEEDDREDAYDVLIEWALGADASKQFDALALIDHFNVVSALPALRLLAERYECADDPSAPYAWAKVNRVIGRLSAP